MTSDTGTEQTRTKHWTLRLDLFEEGDLTSVHAVLDTGDRALESRASAQRSPTDRPVAEIGDEFAAGRALVDLGHQLLRAGTVDSSAEESLPHS
ncbi:dsRBD fold-containing protein [Streptacidiphilus sp. EB129]|uniref:dsRBD fold-containing protein n=1 Tax=Streptacidiphilus sp. EB129 TaxID=3156262 RepID=UPI00351840F7